MKKFTTNFSIHSASLQDWSFWSLFVFGLVLYASPIIGSEFLPFSDLPGHLGVVGAVIHRNTLGAGIEEYYLINPHFAPNSLEFYFLWFFGEIFSLLTAARLFALLCVVALPLSFLYALNSFEKNRWLVFLAFPFSYPRIMWYGFLGSALGISALLLSVGAAWRSSTRRGFRSEFVCAVSLCFAGLAHPFFFLASLAMVLCVFILSSVKPLKAIKRLTPPLVFLPSILIFYEWFLNMLSGMAASKGSKAIRGDQGPIEALWSHLEDKRPEPEIYWQWLDEWSLHAYRDRSLEDTVIFLVTAAFAACFCVALLTWITKWGLLSVESLKKLKKERTKRFRAKTKVRVIILYKLKFWRYGLPGSLVVPMLFACILVAYVHLPGAIKFPVVWWAVAQRLVTPLILFAFLLVPKSLPRRAAPILVAPAIVAMTMYGVHLREDFVHHFNEQEMQGLKKALSHIPRGKRVMGLYDDKETHYSHFQLHFGASYYVALRGGFALPFPVAPGYKDIAWAYPKKVTPGPPWGKFRYFKYSKHARYYDYFLIKQRQNRRIKFRRFPQKCVNIKGPFGLWWVVERRKTPGC